MYRLILLLIVLTISASCKKEPTYSALQILQKSSDSAGYSILKNSEITFNIKDFHYKINRRGHDVEYIVERTQDTTTYLATYRNGLTEYFVNTEKQPPGTYELFTNTRLEGLVNSLSIPHIFLDYGVKAQREEDVTIRQKTYFTLNVSITNPDPEKEDDIFILYIDKETFLVDYFADQYQLTGNKKLFRRLYNSRYVNGVRFYDQYVYISRVDDTPLELLYSNFNIGAVQSTNNFELQNITVTPH